MSLSQDLTTDLDTFLDTTDFAVAATLNGTTAINVIFDAAYEAVNLQTGEVEGAAPVAICKSSDVSGVSHGDTLDVNGTTYYVRGIQPDGTGLTTLILSED